jgi:hypothetical protein
MEKLLRKREDYPDENRESGIGNQESGIGN